MPKENQDLSKERYGQTAKAAAELGFQKKQTAADVSNEVTKASKSEPERRKAQAMKTWQRVKEKGLENKDLKNSSSDRYQKALGQCMEDQAKRPPEQRLNPQSEGFDQAVATKMLVEGHKPDQIAQALEKDSPKAGEKVHAQERKFYGNRVTAEAMERLKQQEQHVREYDSRSR